MRGKTAGAISQAVSAGRIKRGDDGLISVAEADAYYLTATRGPISTQPSNVTVADSRGRKLEADAKLAEIKAAEAGRELVDRSAVIATWFALARTIRERLVALPVSVEARCAGLPMAERQAQWDRAIREVLTELPQDPPGLPDAIRP
jgi:hypothetical protein